MRLIDTNLPVPELSSAAVEERVIAKVRLKLMTPMIGGGTTAGQVDPVWPIRASSVRGHLRWWWRASRGALYGSPDELAEAEGRIWGAGEVWGAVKLSVRVLQPGRVQDFNCPAYAKGPLAIGNNLQGLRDCVFEVELSRNDDKRLTKEEIGDVKQALRLWILYGGIGARTRRGFGSLMPDDDETKKYLVEVGKFVQRESAACAKGNYSHLHGACLLSFKTQDAQTAWTKAIESYMHFRRGELPESPRSQDTHSPWPEADMMRIMQNGCQLDKKTRRAPPYNLPRAQLGLPLAMRSMPNHFGPYRNTTIEGRVKERSRLASLALCKPMWTPDGIQAAVLLLVQPSLKADSLQANGTPIEITIDATDGPSCFESGVLEKSVRSSLRNYLVKHCNFKQTEGEL